MNAVIYARVATAEAAELRLQRFLTYCRRYAAQAGYTIVAEFQDIGSGEHVDRPRLMALRQIVSQDSVAGVIVYTMSQLTRSGRERVVLQREFARNGATIHVVWRSNGS